MQPQDARSPRSCAPPPALPDDAGPNGASVRLVATRAVGEGEELRLAYKAGVLHRPDACLALYFFLPDARDPPLLAALDLPGGGRYNPGRRTPADDESLGACRARGACA